MPKDTTDSWFFENLSVTCSHNISSSRGLGAFLCLDDSNVSVKRLKKTTSILMYKGWTENELKSSKSPKTLVQDLQKITCSGCMGEKKGY